LQSSSILSKRSTAPPTLLPVSSSGTKHRIWSMNNRWGARGW
jgi:hypothetical protein